MIKKATQAQVLRFIGWFFFINSLVFLFFGFSYLRIILASTSLFNNGAINYAHYYPGKILVLGFVLVTYLSHMVLLAFIPAIFVFILACIVPSQRFICWLSVLLATASIICLLIDNRVYIMFKFHINSTLLSFVFSKQWSEVFDFSNYELILLVLATVVAIIAECGIAWIVWKKIVVTGRLKIGLAISVCWLGGVLLSYLTLMLSIAQNNTLLAQQVPVFPLLSQLADYVMPGKNAQDILRRCSELYFAQPLFPNEPLHYPLHPMRCKSPENPYNIILIMVDSLRFDSLQGSYMPKVSEFGKKSWQFQKHSSGGNATQPGVFSLFYSIPSNYWTAALQQKKTPLLMDLLVKYGYETKIIWSMGMSTPSFDKTIYAGLADLPLNGAPGTDIGNRDRDTTTKAIQYLTSRKQKKPFFLHLFYDAPHGFCRHQNFPTPYQPIYAHCSRIALNADTDPVPYYNRYLNAAQFDDGEIGKVLDTIEQQGYLQNSIIIFTSDHGQEFNDSQQNYWGHGSNFTKTQMHVPLIIHWPGEKPREINYVTSGYDVVPTLLTSLFSCKNPTSDYSVGYNLLDEHGRLPLLLVGSYINMGIIEPDRLTTLESSGRINITELDATPLPNAKSRRIVTNKALALMRAYF